MQYQDYYRVLGVPRDAPAAEIKKAFRKLARQYHPDISKEPDAEARMKEINEAYAAMTRGDGRSRPGAKRESGPRAEFDEEPLKPRRSGPPRPKPTRPVTARLDLSGTIRPRNAPLRPVGASSAAGAAGAAGRATTLGGHPPTRFAAGDREPPQASDPTGPLERSRVRNFRRPAPPPLELVGRVRRREVSELRVHLLLLRRAAHVRGRAALRRGLRVPQLPLEQRERRQRRGRLPRQADAPPQRGHRRGLVVQRRRGDVPRDFVPPARDRRGRVRCCAHAVGP